MNVARLAVAVRPVFAHHVRPTPRALGFTLIELMVAMAVALLVLAR